MSTRRAADVADGDATDGTDDDAYAHGTQQPLETSTRKKNKYKP